MEHKKRVIIIDFMHLAYSYAFGGANSETRVLRMNGVPTQVDITILKGAINTINKWSNNGEYPLVVCFDTTSTEPSRKKYFESLGEYTKSGKLVGYGKKLSNYRGKLQEGVNICQNVLSNVGICCLRSDKYEAEDLVMASVVKAKELYPDMPIDIITGNQDLMALVDNQVSVFIRSKNMTWAESKELEKKHYVQVTPANFESYISSLSEFKNLYIPYNSLVLKKLLRGKKADNLPPLAGMTPSRYNSIINAIYNEFGDSERVFSYGIPECKVYYKGTEKEVPKHLIETTPKEFMVEVYEKPKELKVILEVLQKYLTEDELNIVERTYQGINLNGAYTTIGVYNRRPAKLVQDIKGYDFVALQKMLSDYFRISVKRS